MSVQGAVDELVAEARERGWVPECMTVALWRDTLEALFDPDRVVCVAQVATVAAGLADALTRRPLADPGVRCVCPKGWGAVADPSCPVHRGAPHTVTGLGPST